MQIFNGFSKLNRSEKIDILKKYVPLDKQQLKMLTAANRNNKEFEYIIENLSENYISNFVLPFGIAPNFLINDKIYFVPMVTEESSVVAATAFAAKFWSERGGFNTRLIGTKKSGQIYFTFNGDIKKLQHIFPVLKEILLTSAKPLTVNMEKRGGGISDMTLNTDHMIKSGYYIIDVGFETVDSMGANFINSCLEAIGREFLSLSKKKNY